MTTLKDLLRGLINDVEERIKTLDEKHMPLNLSFEEKEEVLDEYIDTIKERIIG